MPLTIAATGHRPPKLGGYTAAVNTKLIKLAEIYCTSILKRPPDLIISGMALGWDQAIAQAAINLSIPFTAAIPFRGQQLNWPEHSQTKWHELLAKAKEVLEITPYEPYRPQLMQLRNEWMVDEANRIVALWDGTRGGTANCIAYANSKAKPIDNLWEHFKEMP